MIPSLARGPLLALGLGVALFGRAAAQSSPAPLPTPIVVPTLAPTDPTTQALINAVAGVLNDVLTRNRLNAQNATRGTVRYFRRYDMQVQTGPNAYRDVHLHAGTVIYPRGATPAAGSSVEVSGRGAPDGSLAADTITVRQ